MKLSYNFITVIVIILFSTLFMIITEVTSQPSQQRVTPTLTSSLQIGATELYVKDLNSMRSFYQEIIGLDNLDTQQNTTVLGHEGRPIITLIEEQDLATPSSHAAGLYHNAIVFKSRGNLARTVKRILEKTPHYFSGTADHLVSEAFYLTDPEGNGLELYFDKDPKTWIWENDRIKMGSVYIDPQMYIRQYENVQDAAGKHMGHIHLKVGNIVEAKQFYVDVVGFDITSERADALFVSVNGYHHHLGMNTWESAGASARNQTYGLKSITFRLDSQKDVEKLRERLVNKNIDVEQQENTIIFNDPWNNTFIVTS